MLLLSLFSCFPTVQLSQFLRTGKKCIHFLLYQCSYSNVESSRRVSGTPLRRNINRASRATTARQTLRNTTKGTTLISMPSHIFHTNLDRNPQDNILSHDRHLRKSAQGEIDSQKFHLLKPKSQTKNGKSTPVMNTKWSLVFPISLIVNLGEYRECSLRYCCCIHRDRLLDECQVSSWPDPSIV